MKNFQPAANCKKLKIGDEIDFRENLFQSLEGNKVSCH